MDLKGVSLIGFQDDVGTGEFSGVNPATGLPLEPRYYAASTHAVDQAALLAKRAFTAYSKVSGREKGAFLRHIAAAIESAAPEIVKRANLETALPEAQLQGELGRTSNQLRLFAGVVEEGSWVNARIDSPDPDRKPVPKPAIRSMLRPLGPVAVFGASNFPLAFSVAGGDTASALAAGNPVIVKAHPAHPGTSELIGRIIRESVRACNLPEGIFSLLFDAGIEIGVRLMQHPAIKAVGFTGSFAGGVALMKLAAARPEPIPCYAEMGSVNPVFILPKALSKRASAVAAGLRASFTLSAGQLCTKPGLIFIPEAMETNAFMTELEERVRHTGSQILLTRKMADSYASAVQDRTGGGGARVAAEGNKPDRGSTAAMAQVVLFVADSRGFLEKEELGKEIFGPTTLVIPYEDREALLRIASNLEGHLTATIQAEEGELAEYSDLVDILTEKVGRLILNSYPTGVEVSNAMVHGGPFPATSDGRSTSVGTQAIFRFARPVCYQGFPEAALPAPLKSENPLGLLRMVDGEMTREAFA